jgi:hypothetical protein
MPMHKNLRQAAARQLSGSRSIGLRAVAGALADWQAVNNVPDRRYNPAS